MPEPIENDVLILLERISRLAHNDAHREGLKPTQWEVLRYLARANRFSKSPSAVTRYLGMTKGTVSQTLTALTRKNLVEKSGTATDRRNVILHLTAKGKKLLRQDPLSELATTATQLSETQQRNLQSSLRALLHSTLQKRDGAPFGQCRTCRYFEQNHDQGNPHRCALLNEPLSTADSELICVEQT